ncbi:MAG: hypothetical protein SVV80_14665 [Planctomycetota bacterium]|nr:hypothetical protein [Planctomycetota bacterium]
MNKFKLMGTALVVAAVGSLVLLMVLTAGCERKAEKSIDGAETQKTAEFVNVRCPIMGTPIDPAKVPDNLTREYKGKKVAFCCAGCPVEWDKLTDAERDAKLAKSIE